MRRFGRFLLLGVTLLAITAAPALALPAHVRTAPAIGAAPSSGPLSGWTRAALTLAGVVGTAITVKDTATSAGKFATRAQAASPDYGKGVANAGPKWLAAAQASEPNYVQGVQAAATRGAYGKGLQKHGSTKYQTNAVNLGTQRYGPGVANAQQAYAAGVDPYLQALKGADLPARGPKGSQQNQARANAVAVLLRKIKTGGQ